MGRQHHRLNGHESDKTLGEESIQQTLNNCLRCYRRKGHDAVTAGHRSQEGTVRDFGKVMYTLLYLKQIPTRTYCLAQGTLFNVTCQPGWKGF